ncbi:MAG: hypothetical protein NC081_09675 [Roseburia sp.]|nr:hypothetical protein [Roseburia sp.]
MEHMEFIQDGFVFYSREEADMASAEKRKIEFLESRLDYSRPESILSIYEKALQERIFHTPVGMLYLRHLQDYLSEQPKIDKSAIPPVPVYAVFNGELRANTQPVRSKIKPAAPKKEKFPALAVSVVINIALVIAVIAMFAIALNSEQANILNYRKAITNQYAGWEQELTEREAKVREKEKELSINADFIEDF